jgi:GNAT superfamily N-acetyltransferase
VTHVAAHNLDSSDPIFDSLRDDYAGFDDWLTRAKREGRDGWVVGSGSAGYAGICLIKPLDDEFRLGGRVLKVSTLKVAADHQGNRYGELLLKTVFAYASENSYDHVYVTVFERHEGLRTLLEDFGFYCLPDRMTSLGELIYAKDFTVSDTIAETCSPLEFHIRFGPPALQVRPKRTYLVPIEPRYHSILFPEAEAQALLPVAPRPFGNALRKAYLCNSPIRRLVAGDVLLFYRSHDLRSVTVVGVVEQVFVSQDPEEVIGAVGQRTVYSGEEIRQLTRSTVLAILFRQDRLLEHPISLRELEQHGVLRRAPQSIASIGKDAGEWLAQRLGERSFFRYGRDLPTQSSTA